LNNKKKKIIIIGSGFGGLGTAIRLAAKGYDIELFEKLDKPGGRAYVFNINGFTFDAGPTVITAPWLFEELFTIAGKKMSDYVTLKALDPFYRIFNNKREYFDYNANTDFTLSQIEKFSPGDKQGYLDFIKTTKPIFEKGFVELGDVPFLKFWDMIKVAPDLIKLKSHRSVYKYVSGFIKNDFLRQCFSFHPLLVGGNPFDTTSIYALIHYLEREWGVHYVMGGTGEMVKALVNRFTLLGGKLRLNTEVKEINIKNRKVTGITLADGTICNADAVVSNADVAFTYKNMVSA